VVFVFIMIKVFIWSIYVHIGSSKSVLKTFYESLNHYTVILSPDLHILGLFIRK
jgi:hypothetical protein